MDNHAKPKLVFFRHMREQFPQFIQVHLQDQVNCLAQFFDVTVIEGDCDYLEVAERFQPEIAFFESGVYSGERRITNTSSHPEIPKVGFCDSDAYCESRELFISDMDRWGVDTFFSHSVSLADYTPEIASHLFATPNFADPIVFRDYGTPKTIPVLLTGSMVAHYPWRSRISKIVSQYYPSLTCPHFGWGEGANSFRMISGEKYARMLNASWIVPTCGTVANELVRKHFEIPAANACLVTERTAGTEAAGFVDGQNCIYADDKNVLDKLDYFFQHIEELAEIARRGHQLVHSRHTMRHRDEVFQWFKLHKILKPSQKIVQTGPFDPLIVVDRQSPISNRHLSTNAIDRALLRMGAEHLSAGRYDEAEVLFLQCLNYNSFVPEPKLLLAQCALYKGDTDRALHWITQTLNRILGIYNAAEPDPVEWAYFIITLLCQGKLAEAQKRTNQFPSLRHPELDRVRLIMRSLDGPGKQDRLATGQGEPRYSLHRLSELSFHDWVKHLSSMLKACQQSRLAEAVLQIERSAINPSASNASHAPEIRESENDNSPATVNQNSELQDIRGTSHSILPLTPKSYRSAILGRIKRAISTVLRRPLQGLEPIVGNFLPYHLSQRKGDEFFRDIEQVMRREDVKTGLVIAGSARLGSTEALIEGARENRNKPTIFYLNPNKELHRMRSRFADRAFIRCISALSQLDANEMAPLDVVLIANGREVSASALTWIYGARFILLDDINTYEGHEFHQRFLEDRNYRLRSHNPEHRNGYAIFERNAKTGASPGEYEHAIESQTCPELLKES